MKFGSPVWTHFELFSVLRRLVCSQLEPSATLGSGKRRESEPKDRFEKPSEAFWHGFIYYIRQTTTLRQPACTERKWL